MGAVLTDHQMDAEAIGRLRRAVERLTTIREGVDSVCVSVPVLYPSGASSTVDVRLGSNSCFVSDMGNGHTEAYLANAADFYSHQAKQAAARFGVAYDGESIFMAQASLEQIQGAISCVSNASVQAASLSILRAEEDRERRRNDEVYDRVRSIFGADAVTKVTEIKGKRTVWPAHNVVTLARGRQAVFEFVTAHPNSISSKYLMFSDVAMRHEPPALNAVVRSLEKLGPKGGLLQDVCNVIELASSNDDYLKYARAA